MRAYVYSGSLRDPTTALNLLLIRVQLTYTRKMFALEAKGEEAESGRQGGEGGGGCGRLCGIHAGGASTTTATAADSREAVVYLVRELAPLPSTSSVSSGLQVQGERRGEE